MFQSRVYSLIEHIQNLLVAGANTFTQLSQSSWMLVSLAIASLGRSVILLLAYPPGHGSDSLVYYLYAQRLSGADFPTLEQLVPPLYPWLILISHHWLGNVYLLIGAQVIMMIALAPIYYLALRSISPVLAMLASLAVLGDVQTAIVANFTHTEPVYIFLLALLVYVLMAAYSAKDNPAASLHSRDLFLAGLLVGLLFFTRPVAKFLIVPVVVIAWLVLQRGRSLAILASGFVTVIVIYAVISLLVVGQVEGLVSGFYMALRPTEKIENTVLESNAAREVPAADTDCIGQAAADCTATKPDKVEQDETSVREKRQWDALWPRVRTFLLGDYWHEYVQRVGDNTLTFLALSGQQYGFDRRLPSQVQCAELLTAQDITSGWLQSTHFDWALPTDASGLATLQEVVPEWDSAMCPPLSHGSSLRPWVDRVASRYRSLGRPRSQIAFWYIGPLVLALFVPRARRFVPLVLTMLALVLYHALISAVSLNVQPRYVVVTNPFRAILIVTMAYLLVLSGRVVAQKAMKGLFSRSEHR